VPGLTPAAAGRRAPSGIPAAAAGALGWAAVAWGAIAAARRAWVCDDAFISFRYAENLTRGLGLVYNAGERVEGYTNFLWTLWAALGIRLGVAPETWSVGWGVACYAATIALLARRALRRAGGAGGAAAGIPIAALLAAAHPDWNVYATSGLETACFTLLALLGFQVVIDGLARPRSLALGGLAFALAALARPDGVVFAALAGAFVAARARPRLAGAIAFGGAFLAIALPFELWRLAYYGDLVPNTYYAKSAGLAWHAQGFVYLRLYFTQYWILLAAVPLAGAAALRKPTGEAAGRWSDEAALAALFALGYAYYVLRVGGDFMHARLLVPATPFFLILLELSIARLVPARPLARGAAAGAALAVMLLAPSPLPGGAWVSGIVNERRIYTPEATARTRAEGVALRRYFEGLPVRVAFVGSQAGLVYYARPAVAIESQTGLTDRFIARQPLARRGRVGHEKRAPLEYLVEARGAHLLLHHFSGEALGLEDSLPNVTVRLDSTYARLLHWDPALMAELERRGAVFPDFPAVLDRYIAQMSAFPDEQVRVDYEKARRFYFERVSDPARERAFRARLGLPQ
jgi:hypothetical protein